VGENLKRGAQQHKKALRPGNETQRGFNTGKGGSQEKRRGEAHKGDYISRVQKKKKEATKIGYRKILVIIFEPKWKICEGKSRTEGKGMTW